VGVGVGVGEIDIVIPTYKRGERLLATLDVLEPPPGSLVIVVDQTPDHPAAVRQELEARSARGELQWQRLEHPSIPGAMNRGLLASRSPVVLFLDDDIVPHEGLYRAHVAAQRSPVGVVAGRVIQPWDVGQQPRFIPDGLSRWASNRRAHVGDFIGANFSVDRRVALSVGGFDENFVGAAYRYESEFAERVRAAGRTILFEPEASVRHLQEPAGGTRAYGHFLRTARPHHAVGEYYFLLRTRATEDRLARLLTHPLRAVATRHHLRAPWWIPLTLAAELRAFAWALRLERAGPRLVESQ